MTEKEEIISPDFPKDGNTTSTKGLSGHPKGRGEVAGKRDTSLRSRWICQKVTRTTEGGRGGRQRRGEGNGALVVQYCFRAAC